MSHTKTEEVILREGKVEQSEETRFSMTCAYDDDNTCRTDFGVEDDSFDDLAKWAVAAADDEEEKRTLLRTPSTPVRRLINRKSNSHTKIKKGISTPDRLEIGQNDSFDDVARWAVRNGASTTLLQRSFELCEAPNRRTNKDTMTTKYLRCVRSCWSSVLRNACCLNLTTTAPSAEDRIRCVSICRLLTGFCLATATIFLVVIAPHGSI